jgi:hypothetical protein
MQKSMGSPAFTKIFKDQSSAINALKMLVSAKETGQTNKQILSLSEFKNLFNEEYLKNTSDVQLEWRLKNMARDLKKMSFENLNSEFHDFKKFFEGTRRKSQEESK